jgi:hypothetical protein
MLSQYLLCTQCHKKYPTHGRLFDTLYGFSKAVPEICPTCGAERELHVTLDSQLGVGEGDFKVVSSSLPDKLDSWLGQEEEATFYPFLVVLQRADGKQICWMPHWHITGDDARFGQHAISLDQQEFESLIEQAEENIEEDVFDLV